MSSSIVDAHFTSLTVWSNRRLQAPLVGASVPRTPARLTAGVDLMKAHRNERR